MPRGLIQLAVDPKRIPKVPYPFPELELKATAGWADQLVVGIDAVLSVYIFPWIVPLADLKKQLD